VTDLTSSTINSLTAKITTTAKHSTEAVQYHIENTPNQVLAALTSPNCEERMELGARDSLRSISLCNFRLS
jgi:hypothetical protein